MHEECIFPQDPNGWYKARPNVSDIFKPDPNLSLYQEALRSGSYQEFLGLRVRWSGTLCRLIRGDATFGTLKNESFRAGAEIWTVRLDPGEPGAYDNGYHIDFLFDIENHAELKLTKHGQLLIVCGKIAAVQKKFTTIYLEDVTLHVYSKLRKNPPAFSWL